jgi:hypothetical protein
MSTTNIVQDTRPVVNPRYAAAPPVVAVERMLPCPGKGVSAVFAPAVGAQRLCCTPS